MRTFYDDWLDTPAQVRREHRESLAVARDKDIPWIRTRQDAKVKLMIANQLGYSTMGSNVLKGEIPVGWHTGKHRHGEESMHILSGEGFSIIEGQRFDWHKSSTLHIPFWMTHQHFNTGSDPVLYLSGMAFDLERFLHISHIEQLEDCGENDPAVVAAFPAETSQYYPDGARAVIHIEDAPTDPSYNPSYQQIAANKNQHDFVQHLVLPANGFRAISVAITHQWIEPGFHVSGRHKHLEAVVYAVDGHGYTDMDGTPVPWEAGDALYVPPAMMEHQHMNENPEPITQLRIQFGIRFWFTDIWPQGFTSQRILDADGNPIEAGPLVRQRERS
jgi:gentisate 1,2-dioxygenase